VDALLKEGALERSRRFEVANAGSAVSPSVTMPLEIGDYVKAVPQAVPKRRSSFTATA
jgi:hypothetical protein